MIESCPKRTLVSALIVWHFGTAAKGLLRAWRNFLVFNFHYFPVVELLKTLFSHWRRSSDSYGRGVDIQRWLNVFLGNMISRLLGAVARVVIIVVGLVAEVFILLAGLAIVLIWLCLPVLVIIGFLAGIGLLFGL